MCVCVCVSGSVCMCDSGLSTSVITKRVFVCLYFNVCPCFMFCKYRESVVMKNENFGGFNTWHGGEAESSGWEREMIEDRQRWRDGVVMELRSNTVPLQVAPCQLTIAFSLFHPPVPTLGRVMRVFTCILYSSKAVLILIKFLFWINSMCGPANILSINIQCTYINMFSRLKQDWYHEMTIIILWYHLTTDLFINFIMFKVFQRI